MGFKIQKPTLGRVVEYTNAEGEKYAGVVQRYLDNGTRGEVDLHFLTTGPERLATGVPHNADGEPGTWRYPPRNTEEIEVDH